MTINVKYMFLICIIYILSFKPIIFAEMQNTHLAQIIKQYYSE